MISTSGLRISIYKEKTLAIYLEKGGEIKVEKIKMIQFGREQIERLMLAGRDGIPKVPIKLRSILVASFRPFRSSTMIKKFGVSIALSSPGSTLCLRTSISSLSFTDLIWIQSGRSPPNSFRISGVVVTFWNSPCRTSKALILSSKIKQLVSVIIMLYSWVPSKLIF